MKLTCLSCALLLLGCGAKHGPVGSVPPTIHRDAEADTPTDAGTKSTIKDASADAAGLVTDAAVVNGPEAPRVSFVQPMAAADPNGDTVVTTTNLTVRCKVTRSNVVGASEVNKSTVVMALDDPTASTKKIMPPVNALTGDEYEAIFDLSTLPNGPLHFTCQGRDLATSPHTGSATLDTLLDLGPTIEFLAPKAKGTYALNTPVTIEFQVTPVTLSDGDTEADVSDITLNVAGLDIPVKESTMKAGLYQTTVDFGDHTLFAVPPKAVVVRAQAKNKRTPISAVRETKLDITIDGDGPSIQVLTPTNFAIVHSPVDLQLAVSDSAGVEPGSLVANINDDSLIIKTWEGTAAMPKQTFSSQDNKIFPSDKVTQLTIKISATDTVGNKTEISHILRLDNLPPVLSLDPPYIRHYIMPSAARTICSAAFDPVGNDSANDYDTVQRSSYYRVLVEDRTNSSPGANVKYHAGVDPESITLYAQSRADIPLLVDTDGDPDRQCDDIYQPQDAPPVLVKLTALTPRGNAWFSSNVTLKEALHDYTKDPDQTIACTVADSISDPPAQLCPASLFGSRVTSSRLEGAPPAVWGLNPTNGDKGECEGTYWELSSALHGYQGWVCLAVKGSDLKNNVGVSAPIHVCIDDGGHPDCDPKHAPDCGVSLTGCKVNPAQLFPPNMVWRQQQ